MRQQPITDASWTESEAMRLAHGLSAQSRRSTGRRSETHGEEARRTLLTRTVQAEIIPRLLARVAGQPVTDRPAVAGTTAAQITRLADLAMTGAQAQATAQLHALGAAGQSTESLMLDLLAPAARELGRRWEDDTAHFADVTLGLACLGQVMRRLDHPGDGAGLPRSRKPRVLLAQMPGEQHGFGLAMVAQFFSAAGWPVQQETAPTREDLLHIVAHARFGLVGLSVSCHDRLAALSDLIRAIRRTSRNPTLGVLVGGPPFTAEPVLAGQVGADATASDARDAVAQADRLMALRAQNP